MSTDTKPSSLTRALHGSAGAAHGEVAAQLRRARVKQSRDTARAVAALFDFGAVGIEDPVEHAAVRIARSFQHQRLIEADAGVPIGEGAQQSGVQAGVGRDGRGVEYQEIVAQPLHLHETRCA